MGFGANAPAGHFGAVEGRGGGNHCATFNFPGPYLSVVPVALGPVITVFDLGFLDLSGFTPGNTMTFEAAMTFQSPAGWLAFAAQGDAAIYLGGNPAPIGTQSPPHPFSDIGAGLDGGRINIDYQDPGPANATTTVDIGTIASPFPVPAVPSNSVPIKLVLRSNLSIVPAHSYVTNVLSATFKVCDHPF